MCTILVYLKNNWNWIILVGMKLHVATILKIVNLFNYWVFGIINLFDAKNSFHYIFSL